MSNTAKIRIDVDNLAFEELSEEPWGATIPLKNSSNFIMYYWDGIGYLIHDFCGDQVFSEIDGTVASQIGSKLKEEFPWYYQ